LQDEDFEWDDTKAEQNFATHGVSFEAARLAFEDPFAIVRGDHRQDYGEDRFILLGIVQERLLAVATPCAESGCVSSLRESPNHKNDAATMKKTAKG
jgi:uncharacterized DUF497 family protein